MCLHITQINEGVNLYAYYCSGDDERSGERSVVIVSCGRLNFPRFLRRNFVINTIQPLCAVSECVCVTHYSTAASTNTKPLAAAAQVMAGPRVFVCVCVVDRNGDDDKNHATAQLSITPSNIIISSSSRAE